MTDIVERLRRWSIDAAAAHSPESSWMQEAANEIRRLRTENEQLRRWKALDKPITAAMSMVQNKIEWQAKELLEAKQKIGRLQAAIELADNRLEVADCPRCVEVARSYLQAALEQKP